MATPPIPQQPASGGIPAPGGGFPPSGDDGEPQVLISPAPRGGPPPAVGRGPAQRLLGVLVGAAVGGGLSVYVHRGHVGGASPLYLLLGMVCGLVLTSLTLVLLARPVGLATVWTSIGVGRWAGSVGRRRLVVVRWLPLIPFLPCMVIMDRPGMRWRLWCGAATALVVDLAVVGATLASGHGPLVAFGLGLAAITVLSYLSGLRRVGSRAWILLRLPFGARHRELEDFLHDEATLAAGRALSAGRVAAARQALDGAPPSDRPRRQWARAWLAQAEGRYDDAAREASQLAQRSRDPRLRLGATIMYASVLADGVAAGRWTPEETAPPFAAAMATIRQQGRPAVLRGSDVAAVEALFQGDPFRAADLAARAAAYAPDRLHRAHALATRAIALSASGHPAQARKSLSKATRLSPDLHHLTTVRITG